MKKLILCAALVLGGCSSSGEFQLPWMTTQANAQVGPSGGMSAIPLAGPGSAARMSVDEFRAAYCELAQKGHGLPVRIDPTLRKELMTAWGKEKTAKLLRPVARTNNAVTCFCATPAVRAKMKCS